MFPYVRQWLCKLFVGSPTASVFVEEARTSLDLALLGMAHCNGNDITHNVFRSIGRQGVFDFECVPWALESAFPDVQKLLCSKIIFLRN